MLGGPPRVAAKACKRALSCSDAVLRAQSIKLEALVPTFLCPAIERRAYHKESLSIPGPSSSSRSMDVSQGPTSGSTKRRVIPTANLRSMLPPAAGLRYASQAPSAAAEPEDEGQIWHENQHAARSEEVSTRRDPSQPSRAPDPLTADWRRKFPATRWRQEMDFNRYSPPLRRRQLPEDAPALYEDEIKASSAWLPESTWTLSVPEDYPLRHELFLILDSLDDIAQSASESERADLLLETLKQARELIWSNPEHPLQREQDRDAALYLAGKVAETYVKLDAEDSMDQLMAFLEYVREKIGVLPMACFHALAARAGITRRYDAVLKICKTAQLHHGGQADAELLHLRLRGLIARFPNVHLGQYWNSFIKHGEQPPRKTFDLLLRTHVRRQDVEQVNQVLEAMTQHGYQVDARAWLTILRGFQSFRPTLAAMLRRNEKIVYKPTRDVVNQLLVLLAKELDVDGTQMVLRIFGMPSVVGISEGHANASIIAGPKPKPNARTYTIMTMMFGRLGRGAEALASYRLALSATQTCSSGRKEDRKTLQQASSYVIKAFLNSGRPLLAMFFAHQVLKIPYFAEGKAKPAYDFNLPPSPYEFKIAATTIHYRILLECASALESGEAARQIVVHLLKQGHEIDREVLGGLARLIFSTIDADALDSVRVIRSLLPKGTKGLNHEREERLESLFDMLQRLGASERIVLASTHSTDLSRSSELAGNKLKSSPPSLGKRKNTTKDELRDWLIDDSSSLFQGFKPPDDALSANAPALALDLSRPLSPAGYALRIRVYAVVRRDYVSAQKVYHAMLKHGVKPTMMHVAPLIEGLTAVNRLEEAQILKRNAKEVTGVEPTVRIHTALIRAYVRAGDWDAARKEIKELTENEHKIDDTIANIIEASQSAKGSFSLVERELDVKRDLHGVTTRFHALMRMRRYLAAQELVQEALDSGLRPDKVFHDLVRRSGGYLEQEESKTKAAAGIPVPKPSSGPGGAREGETAGEIISHIFEIAQALRQARINTERVAKSMQNHSELSGRRLQDHRKKVISLIMDFADGKLHEQARAMTERAETRRSSRKGRKFRIAADLHSVHNSTSTSTED